MKRKLKKNQGITLIALVITIVVLLILAGITINAITGNEGILEKAQSAKINTDVGNLKEEALLASMDYKLQTGKENDFEYYINKLNNVTKTKLALDTFYLERGEAKITINADGEVTEGKVDVWDGTSATPTIDETNKEIHIFTTQELKGLADLVNGGNNLEGYKIYLENNLDFGARAQNGEWETDDNKTNRKWTPIAKEKTNALKATFYGKNHFIKGIYVNESTANAGIFGNSGSVSNLTVKDSYIKSPSITGGISGALRSGEINDCHNINTTVIGKAEDDSIQNQATGGIVGVLGNSLSVKNCTNTGHIKGNRERTGGIVGHSNANAIIMSSTNYGTIDGDETGTFVGGVVGHLNSGGKASNCINYGTVVKVLRRAGGIVGNSSSTTVSATVTECMNYGRIDGIENVGGIIGETYGLKLSCCINLGEIISEKNAGGIIGSMGGGENKSVLYSISDNYNKAKIISNECAGGVVGYVNPSYVEGTIENNYNIGTVSLHEGILNLGGIVGMISNNAINISNNYVLKGKAPTTSTAIEKTAEEMQTDTFAQLLGSNNWTRVEGKNDGYPMLKWEV